MEKLLGCLVVILPALGVLALSWMVICLIVQLIGFCFGLGVTLLQATGVWLALILVLSLLRAAKDD